MEKISTIVLAAGKSTRMKSSVPKVLHPVCGRPLVFYPVMAARKSGSDRIVVVVNEENKKDFEAVFLGDKSVSLAVQAEAKGTGDAVKSASALIDKTGGYVFIIPGDVPLIKAGTLQKLAEETVSKRAVCGLLTMEMPDPASYGRVLRDAAGRVVKIIEARDSTREQLDIREVNSGIYCAAAAWLFETLEKIKPQNSQKEYYLTDIVSLAVSEGKTVAASCVKNPNELVGVNTRKELADANKMMRIEILNRLMLNGVGIADEGSAFIDDGVDIGEDTNIFPNCFISGTTKIGKGCTIENGVVIRNSQIADGVQVKSYSVIEDSRLEKSAMVGPFARIRPGSVIESGAKVGNFVEVKKSLIKKGAKANHLSYIGDAVVGERTNVGCGTITCNYDGREKHRTVIGNDVFVGSDVQFVAPVKIGDGSTIGAGSTITEDVPENSLAVARAKQVNKKDWMK